MGANFALLGEVATPRQWIGLGMVALGVLVFATAPHARVARG
jgi:drug/metabolite transporter (DMT)-like permease